MKSAERVYCVSSGIYRYKNYIIRTSSKRGGKAGRGRNRTASLQITRPTKDGFLLKKHFSLIVGNYESYDRAWKKMVLWIDKHPIQPENAEKLTTNEVMDVISDHLQEVNKDEKERVKRIKEFLDFLNYNLRLTELSKEEKEDFARCMGMPGLQVSEEERKILDKCQTPEKREYFIEMWARSKYFRRCDWLRYLYGESPDKPPMPPKKKVEGETNG